jgi:hypothetical protein
MIYVSEPLEDLLTLSGYAKLYAELHANNDLWQPCELMWTAYIEGEHGRARLEFITHSPITRTASSF